MIYFTGTRSNHKYKFTPKAAPSSYFKYLCFHRFILVWSHAKCINLSKAGFKYYLDYPDIEWTCCCVAAWCIGSVLPYPLFNSSNLNFLDF